MCLGSSGKKEAQQAQQQADAEKATRNHSIDWLNSLFGVRSQLGANQPDATTVANNAAAREQLYTNTGKAVSAYFGDDLNRQHDVALRNTRFSLARAGLTGGSVDADKRADVDSAFEKGQLDVASRAQDAINRARSADEETRLNLAGQIQNGLDGSTAIESAGRQLSTNLANAEATTRANALGDLFSNIAEAQTPVLGQAAAPRLLRGGTGRVASYFGTTGAS